MGASASLEKTLETMGDQQLVSLVHQAYQTDATRMERILTLAKMRHLQGGGSVPASAPPLSGSPRTSTSPPSASTAVASINSASLPSSISPLVEPSPTTDRMAALWTFPGHTLRPLRSGLATKKRDAPGADPTPSVDAAASVDADGYPILYGSCGREKKYARCSVCYFRGVRCNTGHYCACCQRPVCVRPRSYPGDENPKICWNVLHVDKDMIQRVDKRRARKLTTASLLTDKALASEDEEEAPSLAEVKKSSDEYGDDVEPSLAKQRKIASGKVSFASSTTPLQSIAAPPALSAATEHSSKPDESEV